MNLTVCCILSVGEARLNDGEVELADETEGNCIAMQQWCLTGKIKLMQRIALKSVAESMSEVEGLAYAFFCRVFVDNTFLYLHTVGQQLL